MGREETVRPLGVEELTVLGGTSSGEERGGQHLIIFQRYFDENILKIYQAAAGGHRAGQVAARAPGKYFD